MGDDRSRAKRRAMAWLAAGVLAVAACSSDSSTADPTPVPTVPMPSLADQPDDTVQPPDTAESDPGTTAVDPDPATGSSADTEDAIDATESSDDGDDDGDGGDDGAGETEDGSGTDEHTDGSSVDVELSAPEVATRELFADVAGGDPGCTAAVSSGGEVVFAEAYGSADLDSETPMTPDTVVDIGSTSKQFTATAIALLSEQGLVELADPIMNYVPGLPEWSSEVTVEQMVHHSSGIPDYIELLFDAGFDFSVRTTDADTLNAIAEATELNFEPGTSYEYSNSNYFLLGQVVLEVTGDTLGVFLADEVFGPLELDAVMDPIAEIDGKATSYEQDDDGGWLVADSPWEQTGDGGVQTTPTQLVLWASEYWAPTIGDEDINTVRFENAVPTDDENETYGFGIGETTFDGDRIVEHSGSWAGFATSFVVDTDAQIAVAVTCTANETFPDSEYGDVGYDIIEIWKNA